MRSLGGLLLLLAAADALKFDLLAYPHHDKRSERCIRNFVSKDTLVVVTATLSGYKGDGMIVNMHVSRSVFMVGCDANWALAIDQGRCWKRVRKA